MENNIAIPADRGCRFVVEESGLEYYDDKDGILNILNKAYDYCKNILLDYE